MSAKSTPLKHLVAITKWYQAVIYPLIQGTRARVISLTKTEYKYKGSSLLHENVVVTVDFPSTEIIYRLILIINKTSLNSNLKDFIPKSEEV